MTRCAHTRGALRARTSLQEPGWKLMMLALGDVIGGKYRVDAVVGRGGMSTVYRATHLQLDQLVAIKVLSPAAVAIPEYVARLEHEARSASRIKSEHVVRVFDVGELPGGVPYLVMEHLEGADLAAVLARRGPLPVGLAIECIMQTCEALAEAHALGIIHRDLKPANLFLTESVDGSPCIKVLDFGISRTLTRHARAPTTDPGVVLGTPSYMAPEQMEAGDAVDARSDIWAIGAILYELLVGHPPYGGESLAQIFIDIVRTKPPRPSAVRSDVGDDVDAIVTTCLAPDPERRFATVADLAWALSELGAPRARDSAERISRVFDRRSSEVGAAPAPARRPRAAPGRRRAPAWRDTVRRRAMTATSTALLFLVAFAVGFVTFDRFAREDVRPAPSPTFVVDPTADASTSIEPRERLRNADGADAGVVAVVPAAARR